MKTILLILISVSAIFAQEAEVAALKAKLAASEQRSALLDARQRLKDTLADLANIELEWRKKVEELNTKSQREYKVYMDLLARAEKSCNAEELFNKEKFTCQAKPAPVNGK